MKKRTSTPQSASADSGISQAFSPSFSSVTESVTYQTEPETCVSEEETINTDKDCTNENNSVASSSNSQVTLNSRLRPTRVRTTDGKFARAQPRKDSTSSSTPSCAHANKINATNLGNNQKRKLDDKPLIRLKFKIPKLSTPVVTENSQNSTSTAKFERSLFHIIQKESIIEMIITKSSKYKPGPCSEIKSTSNANGTSFDVVRRGNTITASGTSMEKILHGHSTQNPEGIKFVLENDSNDSDEDETMRESLDLDDKKFVFSETSTTVTVDVTTIKK